VVRFRFRPLILRGKGHGYSMDRRMDGPQTGLDAVTKRKNCPCLPLHNSGVLPPVHKLVKRPSYWINTRGELIRGSPPASVLSERLTTPHRKNPTCYERYTGPRKWTDYLGRLMHRKVSVIFGTWLKITANELAKYNYFWW